MKKLGFGLMRLPLLDAEDPASIDTDRMKRMVDSFLQNGFTYFDTAYMYHKGESERAVRTALTSRYPRDSYLLADKLPVFYLQNASDNERIFAEQLEKCGVEYFDYYLLHALNHDSYENKVQPFDCFGFGTRMKEAGKIRHLGFSFHDTPEVLDRILTEHPEVEFVQLQINYFDWDSESVQSRRCYEVARAHGKQVIVMEPVKGGMLATLPASFASEYEKRAPGFSLASWAIRFAAGLDGVMTTLSGMSDEEQLADNLSYMKEFSPLTEGQLAFLPAAVDRMISEVAVACTGCRYCTTECPQKIDIPSLFSLYNAFRREGGEPDLSAYEAAVEGKGRASSCVGCRSCVKMCPQHIRIPFALRQIALAFEKKGK